jgi:hypothetical protein
VTVPTENFKVYATVNGTRTAVTANAAGKYLITLAQVGDVLVEVEADGYNTWSKTLAVKDDITAEIKGLANANAPKVDEIAEVSVTAPTENFKVYATVNGGKAEITKDANGKYLIHLAQAGDVLVEVEADHYNTWSQTLKVKAQTTAEKYDPANYKITAWVGSDTSNNVNVLFLNTVTNKWLTKDEIDEFFEVNGYDATNVVVKTGGGITGKTFTLNATTPFELHENKDDSGLAASTVDGDYLKIKTTETSGLAGTGNEVKLTVSFGTDLSVTFTAPGWSNE